MNNTIQIPKDKPTIAISLSQFDKDDNKIFIGDFVSSFNLEAADKPEVWASITRNLIIQIMHKFEINPLVNFVIYSPKTESRKEILSYSGEMNFEKV